MSLVRQTEFSLLPLPFSQPHASPLRFLLPSELRRDPSGLSRKCQEACAMRTLFSDAWVAPVWLFLLFFLKVNTAGGCVHQLLSRQNCRLASKDSGRLWVPPRQAVKEWCSPRKKSSLPTPGRFVEPCTRDSNLGKGRLGRGDSF